MLIGNDEVVGNDRTLAEETDWMTNICIGKNHTRVVRTGSGEAEVGGQVYRHDLADGGQRSLKEPFCARSARHPESTFCDMTPRTGVECPIPWPVWMANPLSNAHTPGADLRAGVICGNLFTAAGMKGERANPCSMPSGRMLRAAGGSR
ncbi:MAG: hypothetical protein HOI95_13345 [Chromatiales bacterium]|nr:hypothetical protein [Chromatiales bacterium]